MSFLQLRGLAKRFGDVPAVDGLSLDVERGEFVSLLGPSGCGKTTTLHMIAGFVEPSGGSIVLDGRPLDRVKANDRGLGIVFQSYALFPHMTVAQNVAFGLEMRRVERAERERRVQEALELVRLHGFAARYPRQLSGGQQQRVALARALAVRPPVLLLDEPLSNLDAKLREDMQIELRRIQRAVNITTILVTHDQSEALALSDRVAVMNRGRIEQIGAPHQIYERPATAFVSAFLGKTNLLAGRPRGDEGDAGGAAQVEIGGLCFPLAQRLNGAAGTDALQLSLRPEKIRVLNGADCGADNAAALVEGRVRARLFLGNHWVYEVDSAVGPLLVYRQNEGPALEEGERIGLTWDVADLRLVGAGEGEGVHGNA
jgi:putative spermidine/putrescine transport system ATP-binding protein